jgi:hypothetical protein
MRSQSAWIGVARTVVLTVALFTARPSDHCADMSVNGRAHGAALGHSVWWWVSAPTSNVIWCNDRRYVRRADDRRYIRRPER